MKRSRESRRWAGAALKNAKSTLHLASSISFSSLPFPRYPARSSAHSPARSSGFYAFYMNGFQMKLRAARNLLAKIAERGTCKVPLDRPQTASCSANHGSSDSSQLRASPSCAGARPSFRRWALPFHLGSGRTRRSRTADVRAAGNPDICRTPHFPRVDFTSLSLRMSCYSWFFQTRI